MRKNNKMKNLIIKTIRKIIRIVLFLFLFSFLSILIILLYGILTIDTSTLYKKNWGLEIPNPKTIDSIYKSEGFQFGEYLEILHYEENEIQEICQKNNFIKINEESKNYLLTEYKIYVNSLAEETRKLFDSTIQPSIRFNENNYYLVIKKKRSKLSYSIAILIIDTNKNNIYSIRTSNQLLTNHRLK